MAKAGLSALSESLMTEVADTGVIVIHLRPGDYRTDFDGLSIPVPQRLFGLFMLFLLVWTFASPHVLSEGMDPTVRRLEMQLPVFILLGLGSVFAGVCFYRLRKKMPFVAAGMSSLGFLLWGIEDPGSYPLSQQDEHLYSAGFFVGAVLQLFIAVSMIVLVLEEVR